MASRAPHLLRTLSRNSHRKGSQGSSGSQQQSRTTRFLGPVNTFASAESRINNPIPGRDDDEEDEEQGQRSPNHVATALQTVQTACSNTSRLTSRMRGSHARTANTALSLIQTSAMLARRAHQIYTSNREGGSDDGIDDVAQDVPEDQGFETFDRVSSASSFDESPPSWTRGHRGYFDGRQTPTRYQTPLPSPCSPSSTSSYGLRRREYSFAGQQSVGSEQSADEFVRPAMGRQSTIASMSNWPSGETTPVETPSPTLTRVHSTRGFLGLENKYPQMSPTEVLSYNWTPRPDMARSELMENEEEGEEGSVSSDTEIYTDEVMGFEPAQGHYYATT